MAFSASSLGQAAASAIGGADQQQGDMQAGGVGGMQPGGSQLPSQQQGGGLPPTGLQQQLASLNDLYGQVQNAQTSMGGIGFDVRQQQFQAAQAQGPQDMAADTAMGSTSLDQMARNLAQRYGMPIGRGRIVDEYGNMLLNPQQLADASGGQMSLGEAAAFSNYVSQAVTDRQRSEQRQQGVAAIQTGLGQVQSNARGSLASMQSGLYQSLAEQYNVMADDYEATDYSYFIQKEQQDIQMELMRRAEELQKKQARSQMFAGIGMGVGGLLSGNIGMAAGGFGMAAGGAAGSGWF
jgi:hypothetical protein